MWVVNFKPLPLYLRGKSLGGPKSQYARYVGVKILDHNGILWEAVGQERGPFSLVNTIEELLERKSSGLGL
jgi:hypothetical protein